MVRAPIIAAIFLAGCSSVSDRKISEIEETMRASSRNPETVEFRNVIYADTGRTQWVCGEINGENGFGGMTGFQRFVVSADGSGVWFEKDDGFESMSDYCDGKFDG